MRHYLTPTISAATLLLALYPTHAQDASATAVDIFDGKSLEGWDGDPRLWKVEDGCLTGQTTAAVPTESNTFAIWRRGEVDDFEFTCDYKIEGGNSGIQVRSFPLEGKQWGIGGYQADIDSGSTYSGIVYGEAYRGILAERGQQTIIGADHKPTVQKTIGDSNELQKLIKSGDWNSYRIVAKGFTIENYINGTMTASVTDEDKEQRRRGGLLALQLHAGPPMKVQFKNIKLKRLPMNDVKKVVFIAGNASHGPGDHEHRAGCMLLSDILNKEHGDKIHSTVYSNGWPADPTLYQNANALVMYSDGGGGHMVMPHLAEVEAANNKGVGIGAIHYAVEVLAGQPGELFKNWNGGYFEANWSVNPHWKADFHAFPKHPVSQGVAPFAIEDEWYFHMRFRDDMKGVTPILTAVAPATTMNRADGPHSGNPTARKAVAEGKPQHMMWVSENANGTRGFGFTGAHYHRNWRDDNFRKAALNAIAWIAKVEVPADGLTTKTPTDDEMMANLDNKKRR